MRVGSGGTYSFAAMPIRPRARSAVRRGWNGLGWNISPAGRDLLERRDHDLRRRRLRDIAHRSRIERDSDRLGVVDGGHHHDADVRKLPAKALERVEPGIS